MAAATKTASREYITSSRVRHRSRPSDTDRLTKGNCRTALVLEQTMSIRLQTAAMIKAPREFNTSSRTRARMETQLTVSITVSVSAYTLAYHNNNPYLFVQQRLYHNTQRPYELSIRADYEPMMTSGCSDTSVRRVQH